MATRNQPKRSKRKRREVALAGVDSIAGMVNELTGSDPVRGEDLIGDPKIKAAYIAAKEAAKKR